jgi:uncharacterized membrane protein required for colicin V production
MNLIDVFVLILVAIIVLQGVYKGFINSVCRIGAFFLSWICAFIFSPGIARMIQGDKNIFSSLATYVDGSEKLGNIDNAKILISQLKDSDVNTIISNGNFPVPFSNLIKQNIANHAFDKQGLTTLGEYTNQTIACTIVNILSFLIVVLLASMLFVFIINAMDKTVHFPVLRQFDSLLGGGFGLILGCFTLFVIFLVVPIVLVLMDVNLVTEYLDGSFLGSFFYRSNFILNFMSGVI